MADCCFKFIIYISIVILVFLGLNPEAKALKEGDISKLERGEVITKSLTPSLKGNLKGAEAKVLIQSSPEKVWNILDNQEKLAQIIPKLKKVKILEKTNISQKVYTALKVCPFLPLFKYTLLFDQSEKYKRIKFNRIEGCFNKLYGVWELEPYKDKTVLTYRIFFDLGFYVPPFIRSNSLNKDLPEIMNAIKNESESN
ncbi:MAG: SRPBCC family protein [Candidatus Gastranaerophilales bacterium]|nr:SRPBCC family protein [Candidatus Gastranaerophilales bacterium]